MTYVIRFNKQVDWKRFAKLPVSDRRQIKVAMKQKLSTHPDLFGKPLRLSLRGHWSLRIGDYRVIYCIAGKIVEIMLIGHRSTIYGEAEKILG